MATRKARVGVLALTVLAPRYGEKEHFIPAHVVATAVGAQPRFCEGILRELKREGFVESERGTDGGFRMVRRPDRVTVAEVILALDGRIGAPTLTALLDPTTGEDEADGESAVDHECDLRDIFTRAHEATVEILASVTIADLVKLRSGRD